MRPKSTYEKWQDTPFVRWNNALARHFFNEEQAGSQVWLGANPELLDRVGSHLGFSRSDLLRTLLHGPPWDPEPGGRAWAQPVVAFDLGGSVGQDARRARDVDVV